MTCYTKLTNVLINITYKTNISFDTQKIIYTK